MTFLGATGLSTKIISGAIGQPKRILLKIYATGPYPIIVRIIQMHLVCIACAYPIV